MSPLGKNLVLGIALIPLQASLADPVTLQFEGQLDTVCIVADYDSYPELPPPDWVPDWSSLDKDSVYETTDADGKTNYLLRYARNFKVELEGVQGIGWVTLWYSHYDYPGGGNYIYDAVLGFDFQKGARTLGFTSWGSLYEDYAGAGSIAFGLGQGLSEGYSGVSVYRTVRGIDVDQQPPGFYLTKITPGVAPCPGKERAWRFRYQDANRNPRLPRGATRP